jgi:hypothetical protein
MEGYCSLCLSTDRLFPKGRTVHHNLTDSACGYFDPRKYRGGFWKGQSGDYQRFLKIAQGSLKELETLLELLSRLEYLPKSK